MGAERFNPWRRLRGVMIPDPVVSAKNLSQGAKLCYGVLARFSGRNGVCAPSLKTVAERLGVSERQAKTYVAELVRGGFLERERTGRRAPNRYHFLWRPEFAEFELDGKKTSPLEGKNTSPPEGKKTSPKENHIREGEDIDLDYLPAFREKRETPADPKTSPWPKLRSVVERLLDRPGVSEAGLGRIIAATPAKSEAQAVEAIQAAALAGYDSKHRHGPRSVSWFVSTTMNYWQDKLTRSLPPPACGSSLDPDRFLRMSSAFDPPSEAE